MILSELTDRKVGICVSGGLDSKTVAHVLRQAGVDLAQICCTSHFFQLGEAVNARRSATRFKSIAGDKGINH